MLAGAESLLSDDEAEAGVATAELCDDSLRLVELTGVALMAESEGDDLLRAGENFVKEKGRIFCVCL